MQNFCKNWKWGAYEQCIDGKLVDSREHWGAWKKRSWLQHIPVPPSNGSASLPRDWRPALLDMAGHIHVRMYIVTASFYLSPVCIRSKQAPEALDSASVRFVIFIGHSLRVVSEVLNAHEWWLFKNVIYVSFVSRVCAVSSPYWLLFVSEKRFVFLMDENDTDLGSGIWVNNIQLGAQSF